MHLSLVNIVNFCYYRAFLYACFFTHVFLTEPSIFLNKANKFTANTCSNTILLVY